MKLERLFVGYWIGLAMLALPFVLMPSCGGGIKYGETIAAVPVKRVFVSSTTHNGSYGATRLEALTAIDRICSDLAVPLGGIWKAWISTYIPPTTYNAIDRVVAGAIYKDLNGNIIFTNKTDILNNGIPKNAIKYDENKTLREGSYVWTGSNNDGSINSDPCFGWTDTSQAGIRGVISSSSVDLWTNDSTQSADCTVSYRLYCFEQ